MKMRTITCFGDRTRGTFLIINCLGPLEKITRSHGLITLWICECFQQCYIFSCTLLPEIEILQEKKNKYMDLSQPLPPMPAILGDSTCTVLPSDISMAPKYHSLDAPWSLSRKSVFCTFLCVLYWVRYARYAFFTRVRILYHVRNA